MAIALITRTIK